MEDMLESSIMEVGTCHYRGAFSFSPYFQLLIVRVYRTLSRILLILRVTLTMLVLALVLTLLRICKHFKEKTQDDLKCLMGKTAIITGGNSGIGFAAALHLACRGCKIILADCVNAEKSAEKIKEITGNHNISYKHLDLSSLQNIRQFAVEIKTSEKKIDILINNAGIGAADKIDVTDDGLNYIMQINYFGSFLLTHLILEPLKNAKSSSVIFTSSITMYVHTLSLDNLNPVKVELDDSQVDIYANSKLCNAIAAVEFGRRLEKYGIAVNSYDPFAVRTSIFHDIFRICTSSSIYVILTKFGLHFLGQTPLAAAENILYLVTNEKIRRKTGGHYAFCLPMFRPSIVQNRTFTDKLWRKTEQLVELAPEEKL